MKTPSEEDLYHLLHYAEGYDPDKARQYYLRTRKLKGRKTGPAKGLKPQVPLGASKDPRTGKTRVEIQRNARAKARTELKERIASLSSKLKLLEEVIRKKEQEQAGENRKSKAKSERAAKERDKPDSAAEKAETARDNKKYRDKNQQKLTNKAKESKSESGGSNGATVAKSKQPQQIKDLQALHTKVKGQLVVAKQKLAAL